jgi:pimeloyl-ACP methyl ester carboxylesterase
MTSHYLSCAGREMHYTEWRPDPQQEYCLAFYSQLARELFEKLKIDKVHWVGTSMGGTIGTVRAAGFLEPTLKQRIQSLTLNDNAPELAHFSARSTNPTAP